MIPRPITFNKSAQANFKSLINPSTEVKIFASDNKSWKIARIIIKASYVFQRRPVAEGELT